MRACYKSRTAKVKDEIKARSDTLLTAADDAMSTLPKDKRLAQIALTMGLYYVDHREAGYTKWIPEPKDDRHFAGRLKTQRTGVSQ